MSDKHSQSLQFDRNVFLNMVKEGKTWDVLVIGGGATGLGVALDAASRGFKTLLLEQSDFAKGTSSRSTKLVHGGVRYLAQGRIRLVYEALHERGLMQKNAPHLVKKQSFIIPCYSNFEKYKYLTGLKMYDWLSGRLSFGSSHHLSRNEVLRRQPLINPKNLKGGIEYFDGQFDDARLAINLAQTCAEKGGALLNYCKVTALKKNASKICGVIASDEENGESYDIDARSVVNATGVFVDDLLRLDQPSAQPTITSSQGIHLVVNKKFMKSANAIMIPRTSDGRVLFAVPWHQHVLIGTTDTPLHHHDLEPVALPEEIDFILDTLRQYLPIAPEKKDVLSVFAGLRPLAAPKEGGHRTKEISRNHKLIISASGLITITGGKWTTYRKMAEDCVNAVIRVAGLPSVNCNSEQLTIHGWSINGNEDHLSIYGSDAEKIDSLMKKDPLLTTRLVAHLPYTEAEVVWAVRNEMARTVEDVLARRLRMLFLDAKAALVAAPKVARIIQQERGLDDEWKNSQINNFSALAARYLIT
jgi:glycerol-3-phosphate dehydrogenase